MLSGLIDAEVAALLVGLGLQATDVRGFGVMHKSSIALLSRTLTVPCMSRIGTGASLQARSGRGAPCDAFREPTFRECRVSGLPSGRRRGHTGGVNSFVFDPRIW